MHELNDQELELVMGGTIIAGADGGAKASKGYTQTYSTADILVLCPWNTRASASNESLAVGKSPTAMSKSSVMSN